MQVMSQRHFVAKKLISFVNWLTQERWQILHSHMIDTLQTEIYPLDKNLANAPTRPTRTVRHSKPLEPITEQQKIMDLAG